MEGKKKVETQEIIEACKCTSSAGMIYRECMKEKCSYWIKPDKILLKEYAHRPKMIEYLNEGYCDSDRILEDAAERLGELLRTEDDLK